MKRFYWILLFLLVAGNLLIYRELLAPPILKVSVLAVGKGDAILVQTPSDKSLLIDVGSDASILRALGAALPFWQRNIDEIILTSTKTAQAGGLTNVSSRYRAGNILYIGTPTFPYGSSISIESARVTIIGPGDISISAEGKTVAVASSTPAGVYIFK